MDLQLVNALNFSGRKKRWLILVAAFGFSSYGAYKVYHSPSVVRRRKRLMKFLGTLISVAEVVSDSAETIGVVAKDLKEFLQSDSDQIPNSLKQISKIARSDGFSESLIRGSRALTMGVLQGYQSESIKNGIEKEANCSFSDRIMDKLMTRAGTGFASAIVGSLAKNLVLGFYSNTVSNFESNSANSSPRWVELMCNDKFKPLIADSIKTFVSTAVSIYLEKTMNINVYDEIFSGLSNPKHETKARETLVSLCNGAVQTLVKTSHQVLTTPKPNHESFSSSSSSMIIDPNEAKEKLAENNAGNNSRLILEVTGRVTFEAIRSLIGFFFWKFYDGLRRTLNVVHRKEVLDRGLQIIKYVSAKSSVIITIWLALFLHIMGNTQALLSA